MYLGTFWTERPFKLPFQNVNKALALPWSAVKFDESVHCKNRKTVHTIFFLFSVICSQLPITRTPDNSNLFRFPLKVRVIGSRRGGSETVFWYKGRTSLRAGAELCWRAIELGLQVSFMDKQDIFDLFRLLTVVRYISFHLIGSQLASLTSFCMKHHHVCCDCQYPPATVFSPPRCSMVPNFFSQKLQKGGSSLASCLYIRSCLIFYNEILLF